MSLVEKTDSPAPADEVPRWGKVTHRAGWILQARVSPLTGLPPYDPEAEWTEAARNWSKPMADDGEVLDGSPSLVEFDEERTSPFPMAEADELLLGVKRAKIAAQIVMDNHERYNAIVAKTVRSEKEYTVEFQAEPAVVRFDPGLIVDLPAFVVKRGGAEIATGRLCLTICMHESRSKIWARISSANDEAWGKTPCERVGNLVAKSRAWFSDYAESIKTFYAENISEALKVSGEQSEANVTLSVRNSIEFVSGDTDIRGLGRLTAAIANETDMSKDQLVSEAASQLGAMVRCVPGMGLAEDHRDVVTAILHPTSSTLGNGRYYLVPQRTARGFRGVYAVRAKDESLLFAGIASTDTDPIVTVQWLGEPTRVAVNSPSQHVTAELANTVAKYF